jgi:hypothetical protein
MDGLMVWGSECARRCEKCNGCGDHEYCGAGAGESVKHEVLLCASRAEAHSSKMCASSCCSCGHFAIPTRSFS